MSDMKLSDQMHSELLFAANAYQNARGVLALCPKRTEDALVRRGLVTRDPAVAGNNPVITVKGWDYLASKGFNRRAEDPGRLSLEEAWDEAVALVQPAEEPEAVDVSQTMHDELVYAANFGGNYKGILGCTRPGTEAALIRRGLAVLNREAHGPAPVITVKGWDYLAANGIKRPAKDPGRLSFEEAWAEAESHMAADEAPDPAVRPHPAMGVYHPAAPGAESLRDVWPLRLQGEVISATVGPRGEWTVFAGTTKIHEGDKLPGDGNPVAFFAAVAEVWSAKIDHERKEQAEAEAAAFAEEVTVSDAVRSVRAKGTRLYEKAARLDEHGDGPIVVMVGSTLGRKVFNDNPRHPKQRAARLRKDAAVLTAWTQTDEDGYMQYVEDGQSAPGYDFEPLPRETWKQ